MRGFWEKPTIDAAKTLRERGSLWNTFVMVGHVKAFLDIIRSTLPDLLEVLASARLWDGVETHIDASLYESIPSVCFSRRVLSAEAGRLAALRLNDVGWTDLGDPRRAFMAANDSSCEARWMQGWRLIQDASVQVPKQAAAVA